VPRVYPVEESLFEILIEIQTLLEYYDLPSGSTKINENEHTIRVTPQPSH
jgi:hypothetical protein